MIKNGNDRFSPVTPNTDQARTENMNKQFLEKNMRIQTIG